MIKLERPKEPNILSKNQAAWLQNLMDSIAIYGAFKDIPQKEKEILLSPYRHEEIKTALTFSTNGKCAFCECVPSEGGNTEVEHFYPKSIYPEKTFLWTNMLPACRQCNLSKHNHDTGSEPIINPYEFDPEQIFYFEDIEMKVRAGALQSVGIKTIEVCGLNTGRLYKPRADILVSLRIFTKAIEAAIIDYKGAETEKKKQIRIRKIKESIETIDLLQECREKYSSFCRYYLSVCLPYAEAKSILQMAATLA